MNALIYGSGQHWRKRLHTHRLLQQQLPTDLRQLGWQLFRFQQHFHAWHLFALAHTIGHPTLPKLIDEIRQWSIFLTLLPDDPSPDPTPTSIQQAHITHLKRFHELTVLNQLRLPPDRTRKDNSHGPTPHRH